MPIIPVQAEEEWYVKITSLDYPSQIHAGESFNVKVSIKYDSSGWIDEEIGVCIKIHDRDKDKDISLIYDDLSGRGTEQYSFKLTAPSNPTTWHLSVWIVGSITWTYFDDRDFAIKVIVEEPPKPDLTVTDISWSPSTPKEGDTVTFTAYIKNQGDASSGSYAIKYYIDGSYVDSDTVSSLSAGGTTTESFTWTSPSGSAGTHTVKAIVDASNQVSEINENNNQRSETFTVTTHPNQSPTAYIDSVSPNPATEGQTVSFSGHGSDPDGSIVDYEWRSSIDGFLSSLSFFSTSALSVGTHTIYFKVKDDDGVWSTEATATLTIEVEEGGLPAISVVETAIDTGVGVAVGAVSGVVTNIAANAVAGAFGLTGLTAGLSGTALAAATLGPGAIAGAVSAVTSSVTQQLGWTKDQSFIASSMVGAGVGTGATLGALALAGAAIPPLGIGLFAALAVSTAVSVVVSYVVTYGE